MNTYVEDEFDRSASERQSMGAHYQPTRLNPWIIALVAVLIFAPLIGWGVGTWAAGEKNATTQRIVQAVKGGVAQTQEPADKADGKADKADGKAGEADGKAVEESSPEQQDSQQKEAAPVPEPELNKQLSVRVLNGRGEAGIAGKTRDILVQAGFNNADAGDYSGGRHPATTTIYYRDASMKAEADAVAELVGGGTVTNGADVNMAADIVVVLR